MEMFDLLERFGLPVMMVVALGWYVKSQNAWIQNDLHTELRESFEMNFNKIFKKNKKESNKNVSSIKDINT